MTNEVNPNASEQFKRLFTDYKIKDLSKVIGVTQPAVSTYKKKGRFPKSEYDGTTNYVDLIIKATPGKGFTRKGLLELPKES